MFFPKDLLCVLYRQPELVRFEVKAPGKSEQILWGKKTKNTKIPSRSSNMYIILNF